MHLRKTKNEHHSRNSYGKVKTGIGLEKEKVPERRLLIEIKKVDTSDETTSIFLKGLYKPLKLFCRQVVYTSHMRDTP